VGEISDQNQDVDQVDSSRIGQFASDLFRPGPRVYALKLWIGQILALLHRHLLNAIRNKVRTFLPIVLSLLFFVIFGMSAKYLRGSTKTDKGLF